MYKLPQTNTNRLHLAFYGVGGNPNKFLVKNYNDNNEKRKNPQLQIEILEKNNAKIESEYYSLNFF